MSQKLIWPLISHFSSVWEQFILSFSPSVPKICHHPRIKHMGDPCLWTVCGMRKNKHIFLLDIIACHQNSFFHILSFLNFTVFFLIFYFYPWYFSFFKILSITHFSSFQSAFLGERGLRGKIREKLWPGNWYYIARPRLEQHSHVHSVPCARDGPFFKG